MTDISPWKTVLAMPPGPKRDEISKLLQQVGLELKTACSNVTEAWKALGQDLADLLVLSSAVGETTAIALFDRIRGTEQYLNLPIIALMDTSTDTQNFTFLTDYPCVRLVPLPCSKDRLLKELKELSTEQTFCIDMQRRVRAVLKDIKAASPEIEQKVTQIAGTSPRPVETHLISGDEYLRLGFAKSAEGHYRRVLNVVSDHLRGMTSLSVSLHAQGRTADALDFLRVALRKRPQSVNRLCLMGELELSSLNPEKARTKFEQALKLDPDHSKAKAGMVVAQSMTDHLKTSPKNAVSPPNLAAICNFIGISLVRQGKWDEGVKQYASALELIRDRSQAGKLMFNMGLAYLRRGQKDKAAEWLLAGQKACGDSNEKIRIALQRLKGKPADQEADTELANMDFEDETFF